MHSLPLKKRQQLHSALLLAIRASTGKSGFMNSPTMHKASEVHVLLDTRDSNVNRRSEGKLAVLLSQLLQLLVQQ